MLYEVITCIIRPAYTLGGTGGGTAYNIEEFREIALSGLAWSGRGAVAKVEVSTDGGQTWREAALQEPVQPMAFTRFRMPWTWDGSYNFV